MVSRAAAASVLAGLAGSAALILAACLAEDSVVCEPGDQRACSCAPEVRGYQTCAGDKRWIEACDCAINAGDAGDAGAQGDAGDAGDGGLRAFMDLCDTDQECETGLCFHYAAKPARCSRMCASMDDCPPPSTGCNGMGICKPP